ncbi:prepilin peptidase [Bacillus sp. Brlt_9]|uniref:prepilin peptidase n=1 Tax=Bacillus sp. Brlt_9 TaxID=3110916 RepID=UPI003F7BA07F
MYILFLSILLFIAAYLDWKTLKIPNWLHLIGFSLAVIMTLLGYNSMTFKEMLLNSMYVFLPLFMLWFVSTLLHFKAIGAGDVKLFGILALFIPVADSYLLLLITLVLASILALTKIRSKRFLEMFEDLSYFVFYGIPGKSDGKMQKVPLGPILFLAFLFYLTPYYDVFSSYWG